MYQQAESTHAARWTHVESDFLEAMRKFDQNVHSGVANQGDIQNGKGDFFTDLVSLVLEYCSGHALYGRGRVPGLIFPVHALDATYPPGGDVEVMVETKAAGAPKSARNPSQKHPHGRPGSADLDKRIKEAGLKTIDLKAEWARRAGQGGGPAGDLVTWLRRSKPLSFMFLAVRVVDGTDLKRTIDQSDAANQMMDGVGLIAYRPNSRGRAYESCKVPTHLQLDRVLSRVCTALRNLP
ncbi:MAG: hypothetical protein ACRD6R_01145 [Candidatus Polarisedimenticolia bacterium]